VTGYRVYENTLGLVGSPATPSFVHNSLTPDTLYNYEVSSVDAAGNESLANPTLAVTTDPAAAPIVLVNDIAMSLQSNKKLRFGRAQVTVVDGNAVPVPGVTVSGFWSGLTSENASGNTADNGIFTFDSAQVAKNNSGDFAFAVTDLAASGFTYDEAANIETSDCITSGGGDCSGGPVDPPGDPTIIMQVSSIAVSPLPARKRWQAEAAVTIIDTADGNALVPGASVMGEWTFQSGGSSPVVLGTSNAVTDAAGVARVLSPKRKANSGDVFTFNLVGVTKTDGTLDTSSGPSSGSTMIP
jgi:hypothetical protein